MLIPSQWRLWQAEGNSQTSEKRGTLSQSAIQGELWRLGGRHGWYLHDAF